MVPTPIVGTSNRGESSLRAKLSRPADTGVGSLDRFDGEYGPALHCDGLADVEAAHFPGQAPAESDILFLGGGRRAAREPSRWNQQFGSKVGGR
jgi:hypothetical protein